jgi:hypothetical protein
MSTTSRHRTPAHAPDGAHRARQQPRRGLAGQRTMRWSHRRRTPAHAPDGAHRERQQPRRGLTGQRTMRWSRPTAPVATPTLRPEGLSVDINKARGARTTPAAASVAPAAPPALVSAIGRRNLRDPTPSKTPQRGWFELTEAIMHTKFSQFSTKNTPLHHPSILAPFCRVRMGPRDHSMGTADLHGSILLWWVAYF